MSRAKSAKNYRTYSAPGSSAVLNTKSSIDREINGIVRDVLVPSQNWKICRSIWNTNELRRIKTASRVMTKEAAERHAEIIGANRNRLESESEQRKRFLQGIDETREQKWSKNPEKDINTEKILDRVFLTKQENVSYSKSCTVHFHFEHCRSSLFSSLRLGTTDNTFVLASP